MKKMMRLAACFLTMVLLLACEQPKSPNFKVNHNIKAPLSVEETYIFLGGKEALIDTTDEDFENLFTTDNNGLVRLSKEQQFNFGDLNDAIPEVDADPTAFNTQVGEISLTNFSSSGTVGSASFEEVTGSPSPLQEGQSLPGGSTPGAYRIDNLSTDYFESAVIAEDGSLQLTITNNLGFNIDQLSIALNAGSNQVGSDTIDPFNNNATETATISIPATTQLTDLSIDISASWSSQTMQEDAQNLVVNSVGGQNLVASQVTAAIESQSFTNSGSSTVNNNAFEFQDSDDFVELDSGELSLDISNNIDIAVENLSIQFPDIVDASNNALEITVAQIPASSSGGNYSNAFDLSGYRILAENNTVDYNISATTENTQQGSGSNTRTISSTDELAAVIDLNNLSISRAEGYIVPKQILLNDDVTSDGRLDLFNDTEAEVTTINGINDISDRISNITFANPTLSAMYETNIGVNTTVYAAIVGVDAKGNRTYLTGKSGSQYEVSSNVSELIGENGQPLSANKLIKFSVKTADNPNPSQGEMGQNIFDSTATNSSAFFSNLPTKIRFVGVAQVNEAGVHGTIVSPVIFDPTLNVDLPFNLSANNATFTDTVDADLSDLPDENDEQQISKASLTLNYTNRLPINMSLDMVMLDQNGNEVLRKDEVSINAASVNSSGFVEAEGAHKDKVPISFSDAEIQQLHQTRFIQVDIQLNTDQQQNVKLRADDSITLQFGMDVELTSTVN